MSEEQCPCPLDIAAVTSLTNQSEFHHVSDILSTHTHTAAPWASPRKTHYIYRVTIKIKLPAVVIHANNWIICPGFENNGIIIHCLGGIYKIDVWLKGTCITVDLQIIFKYCGALGSLFARQKVCLFSEPCLYQNPTGFYPVTENVWKCALQCCMFTWKHTVSLEHIYSGCLELVCIKHEQFPGCVAILSAEVV